MNLVVLMTVLLVSLTSFAARKTMVCTDNMNDSWRLSYDVSTGKATISSFDSELGRWKMDYKFARVVRAADGGPMTISGQDEAAVDWSKTDRCFVLGKLSLYFTFHRGQANLTLNPNIKADPSKPTCSIPRLMRPAPRTLNCQPRAN